VKQKNADTVRQGRKGSEAQMQKHRTHGGLAREIAYLYDDEDFALEERAKKERCSKSEVIRRALRQYLRTEAGEDQGRRPQSGNERAQS
jgi:hypothetical protein